LILEIKKLWHRYDLLICDLMILLDGVVPMLICLLHVYEADIVVVLILVTKDTMYSNSVVVAREATHYCLYWKVLFILLFEL
jgi:hypothetical protein